MLRRCTQPIPVRQSVGKQKWHSKLVTRRSPNSLSSAAPVGASDISWNVSGTVANAILPIRVPWDGMHAENQRRCDKTRGYAGYMPRRGDAAERTARTRGKQTDQINSEPQQPFFSRNTLTIVVRKGHHPPSGPRGIFSGMHAGMFHPTLLSTLPVIQTDPPNDRNIV